MKEHLLPALKLTLICVILFSGLYPLAIWGIAQASPHHGKSEMVECNGRIVGYKLVGQKFTDDKYFWSRPSAVGYNAAGSGGSNKGPSNPEYLATVQARIDSFRVHNPGVNTSDIPADLITASGSGLDPHISVQAALVQMKRIAQVRNVSEESLKQLVEKHIHAPLFGLLGPSTMNVLELNIALDQLK